jgi:hypothetical protein
MKEISRLRLTPTQPTPKYCLIVSTYLFQGIANNPLLQSWRGPRHGPSLPLQVSSHQTQVHALGPAPYQ